MHMDERPRFFLSGRAALDDATGLMRAYGEAAAEEAAVRAAASRHDGNLLRFCHWRQIARAIAALSDEDVTGTVH